jgi:hypothetical protein
VLGATYSGLAGGGLLGWLSVLGRRGRRAPERRARADARSHRQGRRAS